jgi:hypothetical protein
MFYYSISVIKEGLLIQTWIDRLCKTLSMRPILKNLVETNLKAIRC